MPQSKSLAQSRALSHAKRVMRLTRRHVAYLQPENPAEAMPDPPQGMRAATLDDHRATIKTLFAGLDHHDETWIFAYGSLIWRPACDYIEWRTGLLHGWHRAFCLGWNTRFRGSEANPGLMLALDRGGACKGALYRLPADRRDACLIQLFEREMGWIPTAFPPRWVKVRTAGRAIRALTFCIDRHSGRYVSNLSDEEIADVLATATGARGSMAEYLHATVEHLEQMGIHDAHLWRLQDLVAQRIEAAYETPR